MHAVAHAWALGQWHAGRRLVDPPDDVQALPASPSAQLAHVPVNARTPSPRARAFFGRAQQRGRATCAGSAASAASAGVRTTARPPGVRSVSQATALGCEPAGVLVSHTFSDALALPTAGIGTARPAAAAAAAGVAAAAFDERLACVRGAGLLGR